MSDHKDKSSREKENFIFGVIKSNKPYSCNEKASMFNEGRWSRLEHNLFINEVLKFGISNWKKLEERIKTRNNCQIRSHFQKYLKKICSKYKLSRSLNEIYLEDQKISKISSVDLKIIQIFNLYKKSRLDTKKKKMVDRHEMRSARRRFFRLKRSLGGKKNLLQEKLEEQESGEAIENSAKEKILEDSTRNKENASSSTGSQEILFDTYNQLIQIRNMNKFFIDMVKNNTDYDYSANIELLRSYLNKMSSTIEGSPV